MSHSIANKLHLQSTTAEVGAASYAVGYPRVMVVKSAQESSREYPNIRALLRSYDIRKVIAEVVTVQCGEWPRRAHPKAIAWKAYQTGIVYLAQDLAAWQGAARPGETVPDIRAFAFVAANRGCWEVLRGSDARKAQLRSQIRCIFALTPGFALWNAASGRQRRLPEWVVGRSKWLDTGQPPSPLTLSATLPAASPMINNVATFDAVRVAALGVIEQHGAPLAVEALIVSLLGAGGDVECDEAHCYDTDYAPLC